MQCLKADGKVLHPTRNEQIADAGGLAIGADGDARACRRPEGGWASLPAANIIATNVAPGVKGVGSRFSDTASSPTASR